MTAATLRTRSEMAMHSCGDEMTILEMLADPVVRAIMAVDRVRPAEVLSVFTEARQRLGAIDGA
jgi:hypothetical protein